MLKKNNRNLKLKYILKSPSTFSGFNDTLIIKQSYLIKSFKIDEIYYNTN